MSDVLKAFIRVVCVLSLSLAACTPVEEQKSASISGRVYFDVDQSSSCENDETGIEGMSIRLYAGACGENMLQTHYTDENGEFIFSGLAAGKYCIVPDFEFKTCGWDGNLPTTAISRNVTLESGMKADLVWFGFGTLSNNPES
ncbi:MAG: SdrD B-like domain-containing protein [Xanthomonadales bacterium]|nr:SdrD B-like domain-containing protein [Xanthomonadales bacterium]